MENHKKHTKTLFLTAVLLIGLLSLIACSATSKQISTSESIEVYLLSDGERDGNLDILVGVTPEMLQNAIPEGSFLTPFNAFLVRLSGKNILIDAAYGWKLFEDLQSHGLNAEQIDAVLITHMHGDHTGGLLQDGNASFPNATLYLSEPEYVYWMSDEEMYKVTENGRARFVNARNVFEAYKGRLQLFNSDEIGGEPNMLFPGIQSIATYGHTPGHTVYIVGNDERQILIWGDLVHVMPVQMRYPQLSVIFDVDTRQTIASRMKILEYVSKNNIPIGGMHIVFPGMGNLKANSEGGYIFTPLEESIFSINK
jgi:glyoxylase-like metal-dependent hydrolase (beta-lactamase superfamily II)